jgi:hypothetical protein
MGKKRIVKVLRDTMDEDRETVGLIRALFLEVLKATDERYTNPETLLFEVNILKVIAEEALTQKYQEDLMMTERDLPYNGEFDIKSKNMKRLRKVILTESETVAHALIQSKRELRNTRLPRNEDTESGPYSFSLNGQ